MEEYAASSKTSISNHAREFSFWLTSKFFNLIFQKKFKLFFLFAKEKKNVSLLRHELSRNGLKSGIKINIDNILDQLCLNFVEQPVYLPWKSKTSQ